MCSEVISIFKFILVVSNTYIATLRGDKVTGGRLRQKKLKAIPVNRPWRPIGL
jgi:hypothetical protein